VLVVVKYFIVGKIEI